MAGVSALDMEAAIVMATDGTAMVMLVIIHSAGDSAAGDWDRSIIQAGILDIRTPITTAQT